MFYIKSDEGYYNSETSSWEQDVEQASKYTTYDIACAISEIIFVNRGIISEVVGLIGEDE